MENEKIGEVRIDDLSNGIVAVDLDYKLNHFTTRSASIMPPIK